MIEQKLNQDWKFWIEKNAFALIWDIPETAKTVTLPHDAMMEQKPAKESMNGNNTGYRDGAFYNYVKMLYIPEDYKDKTLWLKFEGVYMNAFVYVNGQLAEKNPMGYNTFLVPLDGFLNYGKENEIRVQVRNGAMQNSRWYSGGGIYRDVYLLTAGSVYIPDGGIFITTEAADEDYGVLKIDCEVKNRDYREKTLQLEYQILDERGNTVAYLKIPTVLYEGEKKKLNGRLTIARPKLWSEFSPTLYTCVSRLYEDGKLLDEGRTLFGIRTLQVDSKRGLRVNGRQVKLRGACIHHDSGLLGAATYEEAQLRQIKRLKEAGFNAVRMAHQPMAPAMLRACDRIGIYVMDEAFDMWNRCKSDYDYSLYFREWWEKDITAMVRKDYNHPSVIMYSVGNEIPEIGTPHGAETCHKLCEKIRELDGNRYTLAAVNGVFAAGDVIEDIIKDVKASISEEEAGGSVNDFLTIMHDQLDKIVVHQEISKRLELACASTDIAGYNYMTARYEPDGKSYPERIIVGSETYPPDIARGWMYVKRLPYVIGDFTWTGWDYLGEAGIGVPAYEVGEGGFGAQFPCQLAFTGDFDITGFRRPLSYYREIVFGLRKRPYIAVQPPDKYGKNLIKTPWVLSDASACWTWDGFEGKPIIVEIYSAGSEVELLLNGKSIGKKKVENNKYRVLFDTKYERGELRAVSYDAKGSVIGETCLQTAGEKRYIRISPETNFGEKDHLVYCAIEICDETGVVAANEIRKLNIDFISGAELAGFGSGNPKPKYGYKETVTETFGGRALLILKCDQTASELAFTIRADKLDKVDFVMPVNHKYSEY